MTDTSWPPKVGDFSIRYSPHPARPVDPWCWSIVEHVEDGGRVVRHLCDWAGTREAAAATAVDYGGRRYVRHTNWEWKHE